MAWNEPGGGKDRDPWGNRDDQGPPDLDEAFRKLQNGLSDMFGGGSGGGTIGQGGTNTGSTPAGGTNTGGASGGGSPWPSKDTPIDDAIPF